jgi:DNA-directed RNA polymerase II subunit RPB1
MTVGVQDIIAKPAIINEVRETLVSHKYKVRKIIKKATRGVLKQQPGKSMIESFEAYVNNELNQARNKAGKIALDALSSDNRLKNMVSAGSKGSEMNISQIMACVGQ